jgi:transposase InsO family protein
VADITYIRLRTEFVYLAVVLDAFSRRVIGWALHLEIAFPPAGVRTQVTVTTQPDAIDPSQT